MNNYDYDDQISERSGCAIALSCCLFVLFSWGTLVFVIIRTLLRGDK